MNATTIRLDDYSKNVIDLAANYLRQTRTGFMLSVAVEKAEAVISEREKRFHEIAPLVLDAEDSEIFLSVLQNPPPPNERLMAAMRNYKTMIESGELVVSC